MTKSDDVIVLVFREPFSARQGKSKSATVDDTVGGQRQTDPGCWQVQVSWFLGSTATFFTDGVESVASNSTFGEGAPAAGVSSVLRLSLYALRTAMHST